MKAEELVGLDEHELSDRLKTSRRELYELRFQVAVGQLENNRQIRKVKKDIARILTVIRQRELVGVGAVPAAAPVPPSASVASSAPSGELAVNEETVNEEDETDE